MTNKQAIIDVVEKQRNYFNSSATLFYEFRIKQLHHLKRTIEKYEPQIIKALNDDLGKSEFESYLSEVGFVLLDLSHTIKDLKKWMKSKRVKTPFILQPASSKVYFSPLGVNLIIAPFNYPFQLALSPLIAAIAAGNTAVIKASELTPNVSQIIHDLINEAFASEYIAFIEGEVPETTLLLEQKFDHIFFTGSPRVGSIVMSAAAKHLTPVTLELGGKSPCVVEKDANIDIAVKRIVFGKFLNAGQTCVAPDYVMVHKDIKEQFVNKLSERINTIYGDDSSISKDYGRIISQAHFKRLVDLIDSNKVVVGGQFDEANKFIAPTVMKNVSLEDAIMKDEIFGPILPVLEYSQLDDVFNVVNQLSQHPLSAYIFSEDKNTQENFINGIQFGGGCINHCLQHLVNFNLPFGGVGNSGIGSYHGFSGFEQFSHKKSMFKAVTWFDLFSLLYPPYNKIKLKIIRSVFK